jgi:iron complex transport system substrate-binding protein
MRPSRNIAPGRALARLAGSACAAIACGNAAAAVQAVDDAGRTITLPAPARRVVSMAPHLTELLFAAGAGDRIVGAAAFSDYPPAARHLPRIGDSAQLDIERIVSLRPDLIVVWRHGNSAQQVARLAVLGIPIYQSEARALADISSNLRRLGRLTGGQASAEPRAERFDAAVADLRRRYAQRRELRVFYQIWPQPLLTINREHLINQTLGVCGARNVFAHLNALTPSVALEAVAAADPDAIVTGSVDPHGTEDLAAWRRLGSLRATRLGHLLVVDPDKLHRQSERIVDGIAQLCAKLDSVRRTAEAR